MSNGTMTVVLALAMAALLGCVVAGGYGNTGYNYYSGMQSMYPGYAQTYQPLLVQQGGFLPMGGMTYGGALGANNLFFYIILIVIVWWFIEQSRDNN